MTSLRCSPPVAGNGLQLPRSASMRCIENAQRICESGEHAATALTRTSNMFPTQGACPRLPMHSLHPTMPRIATTSRRDARAEGTASLHGRRTLPRVRRPWANARQLTCRALQKTGQRSFAEEQHACGPTMPDVSCQALSGLVGTTSAACGPRWHIMLASRP
jgi:hypothetical protein